MFFYRRFAMCIGVAALCSVASLIRTASAQDAMQLDTMFRDSLLRKPEPEQGRHQLRIQREQIEVTRRRPRLHRHKKL